MKLNTMHNLAFCAAVAGLSLSSMMPAWASGDDDSQAGAQAAVTRLRTRLSGAAIGGLVPSGSADFRWDSARSRGRLNIQVEDVNLPEGSVLTVYWVRDMNKTVIGTITVSAAPIRGGEIELNTLDGEVVPALKHGDVIVVRGSSRTILAGAL